MAPFSHCSVMSLPVGACLKKDGKYAILGHVDRQDRPHHVTVGISQYLLLPRGTVSLTLLLTSHCSLQVLFVRLPSLPMVHCCVSQQSMVVRTVMVSVTMVTRMHFPSVASSVIRRVSNGRASTTRWLELVRVRHGHFSIHRKFFKRWRGLSMSFLCSNDTGVVTVTAHTCEYNFLFVLASYVDRSHMSKHIKQA